MQTKSTGMQPGRMQEGLSITCGIKVYWKARPLHPKPISFACEFKHRDNYTAPAGGLVFWNKKVGEMVEKGDLIATILVPGGKSKTGTPAEYPVRAVTPGVLLNLGRSQVAHQGLSIFSVLTHLSKIP